MSDEKLCEHFCQYHPPVETGGYTYLRVWTSGELDELADMRTRLDHLDSGERRRLIAWLTDYYTEGVSS